VITRSRELASNDASFGARVSGSGWRLKSGISVFRNVNVLKARILLFAALAFVPFCEAASSDSPPAPSFTPQPLNVVIDNLVRKDRERAQSLLSAESTRVYRLVYTGFPGDREAAMTVHALYSSPCDKEFEIISETGSRAIVDHVFKKLLADEKEAAKPEIRDRMVLNPENYDFRLVRYQPSDRGWQYVLEVMPKLKSKYAYRGKIWVDANDFAVTRIDAEPSQSPSFWTKHSEFHHQYVRIQGFWVPAHNESVSYIRMGGRATLTIDYKDYQLNRASNRAARTSTPAFLPQSPALFIPPR